ncbi:MAG: hypothetical protein WC781_05015 [Candidatus Pacearchaeota archaeon]|jgi:hypothetical protein
MRLFEMLYKSVLRKAEERDIQILSQYLDKPVFLTTNEIDGAHRYKATINNFGREFVYLNNVFETLKKYNAVEFMPSRTLNRSSIESICLQDNGSGGNKNEK